MKKFRYSKKSFFRKKILKKRDAIPPFLRQKKSKKILSLLQKTPLFKKAKSLALYFSVQSEVETQSFIKKMIKKKKIFLPRVVPQKKTMKLCRIKKMGDLQQGYGGIQEPKRSCPMSLPSQMDLIIVPGVAFDIRGYRLGRGGGYYDRLLRKAPCVPKIGLCFREQRVRKLPAAFHDVMMDSVITD